MKRLRKGSRAALLLSVIADEGPAYGLQIVDEVERRTRGDLVLSAGGIYPALRRFELNGWVDVDFRWPHDPIGTAVNRYSITPAGGIGMVCHYTITTAGKAALETVREPGALQKRFKRLFGLVG